MADELISGAAGPSYVLTSEDVGRFLYCRVTATNVAGNSLAVSAQVGPIQFAGPPGPPVNTDQPIIVADANPAEGETVYCPTGTWIGSSPITHSYQWMYWPTTVIPGATTNSRLLVDDDVGLFVLCRVTAHNAFGDVFADSNPLGPILATGGVSGLPANTALPGIDDVTPGVPEVLTCSTGVWTGVTPMSFVYQWYHTPSTSIFGPSASNTYTLVPGDVGEQIFCRVTASNVVGSTSADTGPVGPVGEAPVIVTGSEPEIDITDPEEGDTLTVTDGTWDGSPLITYSHQWMYAVVDELGDVVTDEDGNPVGVEIEGETGDTYVVGGGSGDVFAFLTSTGAGSSDGNTFSTGAIDTTGAGLLIVGLSDYSTATGVNSAVISDNKGNTWTALTQYSGSEMVSRIWYSKPTTVGSGHTVTATYTVAGYGSVTFAAFSGGAASPADLQTGGTSSGTTASAGAGITPSVNNALVIANVCVATSASAISGGFTALSEIANVPSAHLGQRLAYLIQTTAAAADPDWTTAGGEWAASIASFKAS